MSVGAKAAPGGPPQPVIRPCSEWDGEPMDANPIRFDLVCEALRERRWIDFHLLREEWGALGSPTELMVKGDPLRALEQELALEERLRFECADFEDSEGRMPLELGYSGAYNRPDSAGLMYWQVGYSGPVPEEEFGKLIDLAAERLRRRPVPVADVVPFPTADTA